MAKVRHLGFFKFKPEVTQETLDESFESFLKMQEDIPGVIRIEYGEHNSEEGLDDGFTHSFLMTFESKEARDTYLTHPKHLERVEIFQALLERVIVMDFAVDPNKSMGEAGHVHF